MVALGPRRAWLVHAALLSIVVVAAFVVAPPAPSGPSAPPGVSARDGIGVLAALRSAGLPLGAIAIAAGAGALLARSPRVRERGWELEAVGVAAAGVAWLAGTAAAGRLFQGL